MAKVVKYPIYPIAFAYVGGIFFGAFWTPAPFYLTLLCSIGILLYIWLHLKQFRKSFVNTYAVATHLSVYLIFISLGAFSFFMHNQKVEVTDLNQKEFIVKVDEVLKSNAYAHRMYARLLNNEKHPRVLITFSKENPTPKNGFVYKVFGTIRKVDAPRNPYDFNYKQFLERKKIYYRIHSNEMVLKLAAHKDFLVVIDEIRLFMVAQFSKMGYDTKTQGFIEALLFGVQINLDEEVQQQFRELGILHVLAVSGMHVVVLFATLRFFLRTLLKLPEKVTNPLLIIFLIVFTIMAGLSGSVVRAAIMCLMAMLGSAMGARKYTVNLMVGSMLLILLIAPNYLFDVGFQLSYLAVFSIVFCYPVIERFFKSKNSVLNFFGEIVGVSIAAQIGVLPLSVFYFHHIPLLFLFGNLVAIPLTNILLVGWFVQLMFSFVPKIEWLTPLLSFVAEFCFQSVAYISNLFSVNTLELYWTFPQMICATLILFMLFWYFKNQSVFKIYAILIFVIGFQFSTFIQKNHNLRTAQGIIIADFNDWIFLERNGKKVVQHTEKDSLRYAVKNYLLANDILDFETVKSNSVFSVSNQKWLVIDSCSIYPKQNFDVVVLMNNPDVHPQRLLDDLQPKQIILHNRNYLSTLESWTAFLEQKKVPYYDMRTKGAYVFDYNSASSCSGVR